MRPQDVGVYRLMKQHGNEKELVKIINEYSGGKPDMHDLNRLLSVVYDNTF
jgi:hypothetical protein